MNQACVLEWINQQDANIIIATDGSMRDRIMLQDGEELFGETDRECSNSLRQEKVAPLLSVLSAKHMRMV